MSYFPKLLAQIILSVIGIAAAVAKPIYPEAANLLPLEAGAQGQDSLRQTLITGPVSNKFWLNIRAIISSEDNLMKFGEIVKILNLKIKDPVDTISVDSPVGAYRADAEDPTFRAKTVSYAIFRHSHSNAGRDVVLQVELNLDEICVTAGEVERIYGKGDIAITPHDFLAAKANNSEIETHYSMGYPKLPPNEWPGSLVFSFTPSGCVERIQIRKSIAN